MARLAQTESAIAELAANARYGWGMHRMPQTYNGLDGVYLGSEPFDAERHDPIDIDYLDSLGIATGEDYVGIVLPNKSLNLQIITDNTERTELPSIRQAKLGLMTDVVGAIENALPLGDRAFKKAVGSPDRAHGRHVEALTTSNDDAEAQKAIVAKASGRLTVVLSNFEGFDPARLEGQRLDSVVAIKANHRLEREIPRGLGPISLGGWVTVDTNKPRQVEAANARLAAHHLSVVHGLEAAGASVASVVFDPREPLGFDLAATDASIGAAFRSQKA